MLSFLPALLILLLHGPSGIQKAELEAATLQNGGHLRAVMPMSRGGELEAQKQLASLLALAKQHPAWTNLIAGWFAEQNAPAPQPAVFEDVEDDNTQSPIEAPPLGWYAEPRVENARFRDGPSA